MWSIPEDISTLNRSLTFAVLHFDGSVEVFAVQKKSLPKKSTQGICLTQVGVLMIADIKALLKGEGAFFTKFVNF